MIIKKKQSITSSIMKNIIFFSNLGSIIMCEKVETPSAGPGTDQAGQFLPGYKYEGSVETGQLIFTASNS